MGLFRISATERRRRAMRRNAEEFGSALRAFDRSAARAGRDYGRMVAAAASFAASLPQPQPNPDLVASALSEQATRTAARKTLRRAGVTWSWPYPVEEQPVAQLAAEAEKLLAYQPDQ